MAVAVVTTNHTEVDAVSPWTAPVQTNPVLPRTPVVEPTSSGGGTVGYPIVG
jgi:hypothetical protein